MGKPKPPPTFEDVLHEVLGRIENFSTDELQVLLDLFNRLEKSGSQELEIKTVKRPRGAPKDEVLH